MDKKPIPEMPEISEMPDEDFEFDNQRPDEKVVMMRRRHPWVLARTGWVIIAVVVIILIAFLIWGASLISSVVLIVGLIFAAIYAVIRWLIYTNDFFILTDQRIISVEQKGLFSRRVSETELENIYSLAYEIKGFMASMLNFGSIKVSTVGDEISMIELQNVENPHFVHEKIVGLQKKAREKNGATFPNKNIIR